MDASRDRRPIVVGVDSSESARQAAVWAAELAAARGAPLHLVHVVPGAYDDGPITLVPGWLTELRATTERAGADPDEVDVLPGATVGVLAEQAAGAGMLVLGSYGDAAWSGMLASPLALALLDRVGCPVAIVRGPDPQIPPPRDGPVVVGVDGTAAGRLAASVGAAHASEVGAPLVLVHAPTGVSPGPADARRRPEPGAALAADGTAVLDAERDAVSAIHPDLPVERVLGEDNPLQALMARAAGARLLVLARHGRGDVRGSTSRALVESAPCPVVVVGAPAPAAGEDLFHPLSGTGRAAAGRSRAARPGGTA